MKIVASESRVTVETAPRGLLAAAAHDLRIAAPVAEGESADDVRCTARFTVSDMRVRASRRHGTSDWHDPSERDAHDIETRIRDEAFAGLREIVVDAEFRDSTEGAQRAVLTVRAQSTQKVDVPVRVEREGEKTRVRGECELSLHALGTGRIQIPLGAIKLDDRVVVTFEIVLSG